MKILFAYDGSEPADAALRDLPRAGIPGSSTITVLTVEEPSHSWMEFDLTTVTRHGGRALDLRHIAREGQEKLARRACAVLGRGGKAAWSAGRMT